MLFDAFLVGCLIEFGFVELVLLIQFSGLRDGDFANRV